MKNILLLAMTILLVSFACGQTATELYNNRDFKALIKLGKNPEKLTGDELYMVGYAYFQMSDDNKAIEFYDKAIAKGLNNGSVHFYKGLSLRYLEKYKEAMDEIELSLKLEPTNQEFMNEKGMVYYSQKQYDKALEVFEAAKKLPNTFPEPYYWTAYIYHIQENFDKALAGYYEALQMLPKENSYYLDALESVGQLEFTDTKNYLKSAKAYAEAIALKGDDYELYYKLMKSYNSAKEYKRADTIFNLVKTAFKKGKLPKEDMEIKSVAIAQFEWNGRVAVINRSLVDPKDVLDISYKVFILNKEGDKIERSFLVEKTIQLEKDGAKHLLCEQDRKTGTHYTYPYGWAVDDIPLDDLQKAVIMVLDGEMKASASSNFGR